MQTNSLSPFLSVKNVLFRNPKRKAALELFYSCVIYKKQRNYALGKMFITMKTPGSRHWMDIMTS